MSETSFSDLFGVTRDNADLKGIVMSAVRAGYAVLPVAPGNKNPICTLNPNERKRADREAREAAELKGHRNPQKASHVCGVHHAITEEKEANRVFNRLLNQHPMLNLAIEVGKSRMLCVDADTTEQLDAFLQQMANNLDNPFFLNVEPTVFSPGLKKDSGEWTHKGGGHFHFHLPEGFEFPEGTSDGMALPGGAVAYFRDRVILVPPSVRPEGPYRVGSNSFEAPTWLLEAVTLHIEGFKERRKIQRDKVHVDGDPIDVWSVETTWASLLEPDGWTSAQKFDSCQCEIWTRPGDDWSSPKSATAHEPGCTLWDMETGHGFLKIWTDEAPEFIKASQLRSLSKLQYVAWRDHEGNMGSAMRELGLSALREAEGDWTGLLGEERGVPGDGDAPSSPDEPAGEDWFDFAPDAVLEEEEGETEASPGDSWKPATPEDIDSILNGTYVQPEASILKRVDGQGMFYPGRIHWVQGEPESGKSWVVQYACVEQLLANGKVLYLDYEQDLATVVRRMWQMGATQEVLRSNLSYMNPQVAPQNALIEFRAMMERKFEFAVIDGVTDALGYSKSPLGDNDEVARWMRHVPRSIAFHTGAAVVCVDHVVKDKENRGRYSIGAQAKLAGVDGATYLVEPVQTMAPDKVGLLSVRVFKDRYGNVRQNSGEWRASDRSQEVARFTMDGQSISNFMNVTVGMFKSDAPTPGTEDMVPVKLMRSISIILQGTTSTAGLSKTAIRDSKPAGYDSHNTAPFEIALMKLVEGGFVELGKHRGWDVYTSVRPYGGDLTDLVDTRETA